MIRRFILVFLLLLLVGGDFACAQKIDKVKMYDFVIRYMVLGASDYNNVALMNEDLSRFSPQEKTLLYRLDRRRGIEEYRLGLNKLETKFDEREYRKALIKDELMTLGEDMALAVYGLYLMDLPDDKMQSIMKNAVLTRVKNHPEEMDLLN